MMPFGFPFSERQAFSLHSVTNNCGWLTAIERQTLEQTAQRIDIVAVNIDGGKIKRAPFVEEWLHVEHDFGRSIGLDLIVIDDSDQIGKLMLARAKRRLPHRTLISLPVTHDAEDAMIFALHARGKRHPDRDRESMTQGAG